MKLKQDPLDKSELRNRKKFLLLIYMIIIVSCALVVASMFLADFRITVTMDDNSKEVALKHLEIYGKQQKPYSFDVCTPATVEGDNKQYYVCEGEND